MYPINGRLADQYGYPLWLTGLNRLSFSLGSEFFHINTYGELIIMPTRKAHASWQGPFRDGSGTFAGESGSISASYSIGSRFESASGSNPEELLAAANAACYSMALSGNLERNGTPATRVDTEARCTIEKDGDGFSITKMDLITKVIAANIDNDKFQEIAEATKTGCPISKAIANNVEITLEASLVDEITASGQVASGRGGGTFPNIRV